MNTYYLKANNKIEEIVDYIGGEKQVVYRSPVLPILGIEIDEATKGELTKEFDLEYIIEQPEDGELLEDGSLQSFDASPLKLIPSLNFSKLRKENVIGWGVNIAVIDSGVEEKLADTRVDLTGTGKDPFLDHGTIVASAVKLGAPRSRISSFKVCQDEKVNFSTVLQAVDLAAEESDIINMSLGFKRDCNNKMCPLCEVVDYYSTYQGKLFVGSAGNERNENTVTCPGNAEEMITVTSVSASGEQIAEYSSKGTPGVFKPNISTSGYGYYFDKQVSGTSFAAPVVTGVCGALWNSCTTTGEVRRYLYKGTKDLGEPQHHQGFGKLDINLLLEGLNDDQGNSESEGQKQNE